MSKSKDDYMKMIYELGGRRTRVSNKAMSSHLHVAAASVTEMINRLQKDGLVDNVPYQGVQLTERGVVFASDVIRRHRLWETFLLNKLNYTWDEVHEDADNLEHHVSEHFMDHLEAFLDYPTHCPHGGVIPKKRGKLPLETAKLLKEVGLGEWFNLVRVEDNKFLLKELDERGIQLNQRYQLIDKNEKYAKVKDQDNTIHTIPYDFLERLFVDETSSSYEEEKHDA